jgi:putative tryptophan/tyrosine transport system substrate-binding protein
MRCTRYFFQAGGAPAEFIEGQNVAIEYRWADDHKDRLPDLAADLVRRQVAVIVANNNSTPAAKVATSTIPIVFVAGDDPVNAGLVASLNRPDGNVTGVTFTTAPLDAKRLQLLHELVPKVAIIAVLLDPNARAFEAELRALEEAARVLGLKMLVVKAESDREFDAAFVLCSSGRGRAAREHWSIFPGKTSRTRCAGDPACNPCKLLRTRIR